MLDPKIYTLLKLEELGSYTHAAQALSLTQPAISHHIRMLEEEYGIQIFVKGSRKLKPTADGALLLKYAPRAHGQRPPGAASACRLPGPSSQHARRGRSQYDKEN